MMASNPNSPEHFKTIIQNINTIHNKDLLAKKGKSQVADLQHLARELADFCITAGKP